MALLGKAERVSRLTEFYQIELPEGWIETTPDDTERLRAVFEGSEIDTLVRRWLHGGDEDRAEVKQIVKGQEFSRIIDSHDYWVGLRDIATIHPVLHENMDAVVDGRHPRFETEYALDDLLDSFFGRPRIHWQDAPIFRANSTEIVKREGHFSTPTLDYQRSQEDNEALGGPPLTPEEAASYYMLLRFRIIKKYLLREMLDSVALGSFVRCIECNSVFVRRGSGEGRSARFCSRRCTDKAGSRRRKQEKGEHSHLETT